MEQITQNALNIYKKNLTYFEKFHSHLYKKLSLLDIAISQGLYQELYALEYKDAGYFDIKDTLSGEWLYNENSILYSKSLAYLTDLQRTGGVFQAQKFVDFSPDMPDIVDKSDLSFHNALWATIKIFEYHKKKISKTDLMSSVFKAIFIGTGLGLHIEAIANKLSSKILFIFEDNLELFRLSLFVTDYSKLSENRLLFFSIMETLDIERKLFIDFLENGNNHNLYIKHIPFIKNYEPLLQRFQTHVLSQNFVMYGYSALLLRAIDSPKYIALEKPFLDLGNFYQHCIFSSKPVLFVFSGPSAYKNIDWIQKNKDRFIIVSPLSTCKLLHQYNIKPDVIIHIDPGANETAKLFDGIENSYFENSLIILASNVDETTVNKFHQNNVFFIEQGTEYKAGFPNLTAPSVGEYSYAIFLVFGTQELYLLGLDLALDPETLATHSDFHPFAKKGLTQEQNANLNYSTSIEYTKGNFLNQVPTLPLYRLSIQEFNRFSTMLKKPFQKIYNLSNGAYFDQTIPQQISLLDTNIYPQIDKLYLYVEIRDFLKSISSNTFRKEDKAVLIRQIKDAQKLMGIIQKHSQKKYFSIHDYLVSISKLSTELSDMENKTKSYLSEVYYEYFKIVLSYIFDLFNTNKNSLSMCKEIDTIVTTQLEKMGNLFIKKLEGYLK